jgi:hypothetical protein
MHQKEVWWFVVQIARAIIVSTLIALFPWRLSEDSNSFCWQWCADAPERAVHPTTGDGANNRHEVEAKVRSAAGSGT